jgi:hypothetical protein
MLAVISALREWRCFLERAPEPFILVTDHQPNVYLDSATNAHTVHRRARWLSVSCGYNYKWCYRPGRENVADPISQAPQHFAHICSLFCVAHCVEAMTVAQEIFQLVDREKKAVVLPTWFNTVWCNVAARFVLPLVSCVHGSTQGD